MQHYPHHYQAAGRATADSSVTVSSPGLPDLDTMPPPEFGGPEGSWSPETLLVASVADCFILTFRAIARASSLEWTSLACEAQGTLERVDGVTRFTRFDLVATLEVPAGTESEKAERILHKSESVCLITASLKTDNHLETKIVTV